MGKAALAALASVLCAVAGVLGGFLTAQPSVGVIVGFVAVLVVAAVATFLQNKPDSSVPSGSSTLGLDVSAATGPLRSLGESSALDDVAATDPGLIFGMVNIEDFTGRRWLLEKLDGFISRNRRGYFFVEADAGMGKTAFAAWLVAERHYVSHFSRYEHGGRSVRGALHNLAKQLIKDCDLRDLAPNLRVPDRAMTSSGFQSLLVKAAKRLRKPSQLVMVVDGLDEAETVPEGMPFGLPMLLPQNVFIVATYRTGSTPPSPGCESTMERIRQDDERNIRDIRDFLAHAVDNDLAGRLAEAGITPADFVALLAARSQGVWVYLRYVLAEVRDGSRPVSAIADLPSGLQGYYLDQIKRWRQNPDWTDGLLPLLATLGIAGEPLTAEILARLVGPLNQDVARDWCDTLLRPLLTTREVAGERLFAIYHASLREFLRGDVAPGTEGEPLLTARKLKRATLAAHSRVADRYLNLFGGLDRGLPKLSEDPGLAGDDEGYPLRHLARHLQDALRAADLFRMLAAEHQVDGSTVVNDWYQAHEKGDSIARYLDDLKRAGGINASTTDKAIEEGKNAPSFGDEIRYALMMASIVSRTQNVTPELLECAVRAKLWSLVRGLDYARRLPDPVERAEALRAIHAYVPREKQPGVLAEALSTARGLSADGPRMQALARLAPSLPPDQKADALHEALAIANGWKLPWRADVMAGLAPQLPPDLLSQAVEAADRIPDAHYRAQTQSVLVPFVSAAERARLCADALAAERTVNSDDFRGEALVALSPYLPDDLLAAAREFAVSLPSDRLRAAALTALAPRLPDAERPAVVRQALEAASKLDHESFRAEALTAIAPLLPAHQRRDVQRQFLDLAKESEYDASRAKLLTAVGPQLPADLLADALATAGDIHRDSDRATALGGLADSLPPDQRRAVIDRALDAATSSWRWDKDALQAVAPHLSVELLGDAVKRAIALPYPEWRAEALTVLAPRLPDDLLATALAAVARSEDYPRAFALASLGRYLHGEEQLRVQSEAVSASFAVSAPLWFDRRRLLIAAFDGLQAAAADQARALCDTIPVKRDRCEALLLLHRSVTADRQPAILHDVLAISERLTRSDDRAFVLAAVARLLPSDQRAGVLADALNAASETDDEPARASAIAELAPLLAGDELTSVHALASAIADDSSRAEALIRVAECAPRDEVPKVLDEALSAARGVHVDEDRAKLLAALIPRLHSDQQLDVCRDALDAALSEHVYSTDALAAVAPLLSPPLLQQALAELNAKPSQDAEVLAILAVRLPADEQSAAFRRTLDVVRSGFHSMDGPKALITLAPHLQGDLPNDAWDIAMDISFESDKVKALAALAPQLPAEKQTAAFRQILDAVSAINNERDRSSALSSLADQLPADLLSEAIALAPKSTSDATWAVLRRAFIVLPPTAAATVAQLLRLGLRDADRAFCLALIANAAVAIAQIGGDAAIKASADAIADVDRWWP